MNKHMRLVASVLFIVIILLAIAITRFYSDTSQKTGGGNTQTDIVRRLSDDGNGNRIFEDSSGLYGVVDQNDNIIIPAEWLELSFTGSDLCMASKRIGGKLLTGCVDYDGNVAVPCIFRNITRHQSGNFVFYIADSDLDGTCVVYSENFVPCFPRSWTSCSLSGDSLTMTSSTGSYSYTVTDSGFSFDSAAINGEALGCSYKLDIFSKLMLQKLDIAMLEDMSSAVAHYLEFAYTGNGDYISAVRTGGRPVFTTLFPEDKRIITKRLENISSVSIYSIRSEEEVPRYSIAVVADTELTYLLEPDKEDSKVGTIHDKYKAVIEFSGSSANDLVAISGNFTESSPEYPEPVIENNEPQEGDTPYPPYEGDGGIPADITAGTPDPDGIVTADIPRFIE